MPKKGDEVLDIDVEIVHETDKAWLVSTDGDNKIWIPKSRCEVERKIGKMAILTTDPATAEDKGLV